MSRGKPNDPLAWAELANRDLFRAEVLMAKDDIDGCMFHLQHQELAALIESSFTTFTP